jgi:hypothetical protein
VSGDVNLPEGYDEAEFTASETTEDGDVVSETVTAVVHEETGLTAIDDLVVVESPDGAVFLDETVSLVDDEGNSTVVSETVAAMDADGDIVIASTDED